MKEQFATYEIALKLKELGFDENCFAHYQNSKTIIPQRAILKSSGQLYYKQNNINPSNQYGDEFCTAPLWQQVIDWLREKHKIHIWISYQKEMDVKYFSHIVIENQTNKITTGYRETYNKAREQAILKAIELIQKEII